MKLEEFKKQLAEMKDRVVEFAVDRAAFEDSRSGMRVECVKLVEFQGNHCPNRKGHSGNKCSVCGFQKKMYVE